MIATNFENCASKIWNWYNFILIFWCPWYKLIIVQVIHKNFTVFSINYQSLNHSIEKWKWIPTSNTKFFINFLTMHIQRHWKYYIYKIVVISHWKIVFMSTYLHPLSLYIAFNCRSIQWNAIKTKSLSSKAIEYQSLILCIVQS